MVHPLRSRLHSRTHTSHLLPLPPLDIPLRVFPKSQTSRAQIMYPFPHAAFEEFEYLNPEPALEVGQVKALYQELGIDAWFRYAAIIHYHHQSALNFHKNMKKQFKWFWLGWLRWMYVRCEYNITWSSLRSWKEFLLSFASCRWECKYRGHKAS